MSNQMTSLFLCISWKVVVVRPLRRWCLLSHKFLIYPTSTTTFLLCYQLIWYSEVMVSWVLDPIIKVEGSEDFPPTSPFRFALLQPSEFQKILIKFWFAFILLLVHSEISWKYLHLFFDKKWKLHTYSFLPMGLLLKRGQNDISEIQNHFLGHFGANCKRSRDFNLLNTQHHSVKFFDDI